MSDLESIRRIRAFATGAPLPRRATLAFRKPARADLRVAFVRMGGESAPWGIGWIQGAGKPRFLTVPEARDRDAVAAMAERFAPVLLAHLGHPGHGEPSADASLWLPGPSHLAMLHQLAISFLNVRRAEEPRRSTLRALGRAATHLFREAQRPGQLAVADAPALLREAYAFPADDLRQQHLGFLMAWLGSDNREARLRRAQEAERLSVATTLDPLVERDELEPLVAKLKEAPPAHQKRLEASIKSVLERELAARLALLEEARAVLARDRRPLNPGLAELAGEAERSAERYRTVEGEIQAGGNPFVPGPLADHGPVAPSRAMRWQEAHQDKAERVLAHGDRAIQSEWVAEGRAVAGAITAVTDEGTGRAMVPVWQVESPGVGPLKLREGSEVVVAGLAGRTGTIRSIEDVGGGRRLEVEIEGWKRARSGVPAADDPDLVGTGLVLLESGPDPIGLLLRSRFGERNGPGSWITRKLSREAAEPAAEEAP